MNEFDLYSAVFDIAEENMQNAGKNFTASKSCFMNRVQSDPVTVDIMKLSEESNNAVFLEKAYMELLKRPVDEKAVKNWEERFSLPAPEFQNLVVNSLISSAEYYNAHVKIYNNIYSKHNSFGGNIADIQTSAGVTMPEKLINTYRKMPSFVKKIAKKAMGVK